MSRDIVRFLATIGLIAFTLAIVASFTVLPMRANYLECGTVFLCHPK